MTWVDLQILCIVSDSLLSVKYCCAQSCHCSTGTPKMAPNQKCGLVVPANNFTSAFPKLGYMGIKKIFDDNKINYKKRTIIQASDLKEKIEKMGITSENSTIVSIDAKEFYPSIKFKLVKKAVNYFAKNLPKEVQDKIEQCLEMVKFGMSSTLLTFVDQY